MIGKLLSLIHGQTMWLSKMQFERVQNGHVGWWFSKLLFPEPAPQPRAKVKRTQRLIIVMRSLNPDIPNEIIMVDVHSGVIGGFWYRDEARLFYIWPEQ